MTPTDHVSLDRLKAVAESDVLVFTRKEFKHLERCAECLRLWNGFLLSFGLESDDRKDDTGR